MNIRRLVFLLVSLFLLSCSDSIEKKLIGEWEGTDTLYLILNKDGTLASILNNELEVVYESNPDIEVNLTWGIEDKQDQVYFTIILSRRNTKLGKIVDTETKRYGLEFLGKNKILFIDSKYPDHHMILTRQ